MAAERASRDHWYRFLDVSYGNQGRRVICRELEVLRRTPGGVWLRDHTHPKGERWVGSVDPRYSTGRRYAYADKEHALYSFKQRKKWQMLHLERQLANAKEALRLAELGLGHTEPEYVTFLEF